MSFGIWKIPFQSPLIPVNVLPYFHSLCGPLPPKRGSRGPAVQTAHSWVSRSMVSTPSCEDLPLSGEKNPNKTKKKTWCHESGQKYLLVRDRSAANVTPCSHEVSLHISPDLQWIQNGGSKEGEAEEQRSYGGVKCKDTALRWLGLLTAPFVYCGIPWDSHP